MLSACKKPFPTHRCGQCEYCRVIDRLDIVNRLKLEYQLRPHAFFVTLTYSDEFLPVFSGFANLYKPDLVQWVDRIRRELPKITLFAVGEYGGRVFGSNEAKRDVHPHYHVAVFSDDPSISGIIRSVCEQKWFMGHVHILQLSCGLIDYISGYVSKKLTNEYSMKKIMDLDIRPEFTYRSRRPAIGDISEELLSITEEHGELTHLNIDGKKVVIPKYLKHKVKDKLLRWDLDLKNPDHVKIYERRKYEKKIETLSLLQQKEEEELQEISQREISSSYHNDAYEKRRLIKKQIVANFDGRFKLQQHTKGKKVL